MLNQLQVKRIGGCDFLHTNSSTHADHNDGKLNYKASTVISNTRHGQKASTEIPQARRRKVEGDMTMRLNCNASTAISTSSLQTIT